MAQQGLSPAMIMVMAFERIRARVHEYAKEKTWYWYIPLWIFGVFIFIKLLSFSLVEPLPTMLAIPHAFDFTLHEFAHVFTAWLPPLFTAAAGSASELILGLLLVFGAFRFRNYFASLFCLLWLMLVCMSVGSYMADALPQQIPLVSLGGALSGSETVTHDWNFIFGELNLLGASGLIGNSLKAVGILAGVFGLLFSAWVMYKMASSAEKKPMTQEDLAALKATASELQPKREIYPKASRGNLADRDPAAHSAPMAPIKPPEDPKQLL